MKPLLQGISDEGREKVRTYARAYCTNQRMPCRENEEARDAARSSLEQYIARHEESTRLLDELERRMVDEILSVIRGEAVLQTNRSGDWPTADDIHLFRTLRDAALASLAVPEVTPK